MGFWDVTKRALQGKPAFEAPKDDDGWDDNEPTTDFAEEIANKRNQKNNKNLIDDKGYKHIPVVAITSVDARQKGDYIELWATVANQSDRGIKLDKVTLLGTKFIMDYPLKPDSQRVFRVYQGVQVKHDSYKKAELFYQDVETNDYFRADHEIGYRYEADGSFDIDGFELITPIRDL
jgi:hypothetical protein